MADVFIAADDFTGANAAAAGLSALGPSAVTLPATASPAVIARYAGEFDVVAVTTDSRHLSAQAAADATARAIACAWPARLVSSRCDSTLRGNVAAEAAAAIATVRRLRAEELVPGGATAATGPADTALVGPESGPEPEPPVVLGLCMPAFPASGRTTVHGRALLHDVALEDTELARDVRSPIAASDVRELLRVGSGLGAGRGLRVAHIDIAVVASEPGALEAWFRKLLGTTNRPGTTESVGAADRPGTTTAHAGSDLDVIVADARTDEDLLAVARAAVTAAPHVTWVGIDPGPGTAALARALGLVGRAADPRDTALAAGPLPPGSAPSATAAGVPTGTSAGVAQSRPDTPRRGAVLAVSGSATELTRRQLAHLAEHRTVRVVRPVTATAGAGPTGSGPTSSEPAATAGAATTGLSVAATASAAIAALSSPPAPDVVLIPTVVEESDLRDLTSAQSDELTTWLGQVAAEVLATRPGASVPALPPTAAGPSAVSGRPARIAGIYTTGGDVTSAVLAAIGAAGIAVESQVVPLATLGRVVGGPHDGLPIVTKGGLVGDATTASACIDALHKLAGSGKPAPPHDTAAPKPRPLP